MPHGNDLPRKIVSRRRRLEPPATKGRQPVRFDNNPRPYRWFVNVVAFGKLYWSYLARDAREHPYNGGWGSGIVSGDALRWGIDMPRGASR